MGVAAFYLMPQANAQVASSAPAVSSSTTAAVVSPFKQCAAEKNITLPVKGSGQRLNSGERQDIFTCVKALHKETFQSCASSNSITLPAKGSGEKLTPAQHQTIRSCMVAKGFKKWPHRHHGQSQQAEGQS